MDKNKAGGVLMNRAGNLENRSRDPFSRSFRKMILIDGRPNETLDRNIRRMILCDARRKTNAKTKTFADRTSNI